MTMLTKNVKKWQIPLFPPHLQSQLYFGILTEFD